MLSMRSSSCLDLLHSQLCTDAATVADDMVHEHGLAARADGGVPGQLSADEDTKLRLHYEMRLQVLQNRDALWRLIRPLHLALSALHRLFSQSRQLWFESPPPFWSTR